MTFMTVGKMVLLTEIKIAANAGSTLDVNQMIAALAPTSNAVNSNAPPCSITLYSNDTD
jgi:hypothetical protein